MNLIVQLDATVNFIMGWDDYIVLLFFVHPTFPWIILLFLWGYFLLFPVILVMPSALMPSSSLSVLTLILSSCLCCLHSNLRPAALLYTWFSRLLSGMFSSHRPLSSQIPPRAFLLKLLKEATCLWDHELKSAGCIPYHLVKACVGSRSKTVWWRLP